MQEPYPTAVMVVTCAGKALILRRGPTAPWRPGTWNLPGGGIDPGESPEDAARREAIEEADVRVLAARFVGRHAFPDYTLYAFTGAVWDQHVALLPNHGIVESDAFAWIGRDEIRLYDYAVPIIGQLLDEVLGGYEAAGQVRV